MIQKLSLFGVVVVGLLCMPVLAKTILTADNVERYMAMQPELMALDARYPDNEDNDMSLEQHCDWDKHYQTLKSQELDADYIQQMEVLIRRHDFEPVEFLELSLKISWPLLEMSRPMLEMSQEMMAQLPAEMQAEQQAEMAEAMQLISLLEQCMTYADKEAAKGFQQQLMQQAFELDDDGEMDMEQLQQMMEQMQQN